jgi:hypothetical protein
MKKKKFPCSGRDDNFEVGWEEEKKHRPHRVGYAKRAK